MTTTANALCFGEGLPGSGAPCHVRLSAEGLRIIPFEGSPLVEEPVAYADLSVAAGGLDHDQLVLSWASGVSARTLYLKDPALILEFRRLAPHSWGALRTVRYGLCLFPKAAQKIRSSRQEQCARRTKDEAP